MALDKVVDSAVLDAGMKSVADAIRAKTGTTDLLAWPDGFKAAVEGIQTGGGGGSTSDVTMKDVNFYDYDGTLIASYTLAEAQALTALPDVPTHNGLTFQGWNWSLEKIHALTRPMNVGAMYITDDGATRLHIRIATVGRMTVPLYIGQTVANGVSIDWGDGSAAETLVGTGDVNTSHTYAEPGGYTISLMPEDGCTLSFGEGPSSYCVMGTPGNNGRVYCNMLQEVYIGKNVTSISNNAFQSCSSLASITIPDGVPSIGESAFANCYTLVSIAIPDSVTSISNNDFRYCYSLASIAIPDGVKYIRSNAFQNCYTLVSITIPDSVTSISSNAFQNCYVLSRIAIQDGVKYIDNDAFANCYTLVSIAIPDSVIYINSSAFANCYGMRYYDFSACTDIPSLLKTNAFNGIPSDCQMLIPAALYDEWSAATNWATYASYMVAV